MIDELERSAYISGRQAEAVLLATIQDQQALIDILESDAERADATIRYLERSLRCVIDAIGTKAQAYEIDIAEGLLQPC